MTRAGNFEMREKEREEERNEKKRSFFFPVMENAVRMWYDPRDVVRGVIPHYSSERKTKFAKAGSTTQDCKRIDIGKWETNSFEKRNIY